MHFSRLCTMNVLRNKGMREDNALGEVGTTYNLNAFINKVFEKKVDLQYN